jgi:hypothetical protein
MKKRYISTMGIKIKITDILMDMDTVVVKDAMVMVRIVVVKDAMVMVRIMDITDMGIITDIIMVRVDVKEDAKATEKKATNARVIARIRLLVGGNEGKEDCSRS